MGVMYWVESGDVALWRTSRANGTGAAALLECYVEAIDCLFNVRLLLCGFNTYYILHYWEHLFD